MIVFRFFRTTYWSSEVITFLSSLFLTMTCNTAFWAELLQGRELMTLHSWLVILCTGMVLTGMQWFLLLLVINRWTFRGVMICLFLITSIAVYFINVFHIYIDSTMMTNVFSTDYHESKELLQWRIFPYFFFLGLIPAWFIWNMRIYKRSLTSYWSGRLSAIFLSLVLFFTGVWAVFNDLAPRQREHKEIVYLITPLNIFSSSIKSLWKNHYDRTLYHKTMLGKVYQDLRPVNSKPRAIVLVIGETVRAVDWGLNGYSRQTTPELAKHQLINFKDVSSCGTATAISLPCMFSSYGFHDYNEQKINQTETLLHLLNRAKISVLWLDNQSGCKGICYGLPHERLNRKNQCKDNQCFDEVLINHLKEKIEAKSGDQLIVLHMLGNHGPAYYERYPEQFKRWQPTCDTADLASCSQDTIVNTYDNALLYTDSILGRAIDELSTIRTHDTALIYLSDHGESLGEHGLFLHGLPYFIAPDEQKKIPMIFWVSSGLSQQLKLQKRCLQEKQNNTISHDYLFSTVLSLFDVSNKAYDERYDLLHSCRTTEVLIDNSKTSAVPNNK
ncbi:MAG: phosphoethanolamine--lipid A transferase [Legionella sp.]|uniref:phosphoethanolamine transferase n=1 Tax=Legionella sp. TaxID=459 RepID=UPI0039E5D3EF